MARSERFWPLYSGSFRVRPILRKSSRMLFHQFDYSFFFDSMHRLQNQDSSSFGSTVMLQHAMWYLKGQSGLVGGRMKLNFGNLPFFTRIAAYHRPLIVQTTAFWADSDLVFDCRNRLGDQRTMRPASLLRFFGLPFALSLVVFIGRIGGERRVGRRTVTRVDLILV